MVKRRYVAYGEPYMQEDEQGPYVLYSDYQKVLEALEETLNQWEHWVGPLPQMGVNESAAMRISLLRTQFLDPQKPRAFDLTL